MQEHKSIEMPSLDVFMASEDREKPSVNKENPGLDKSPSQSAGCPLSTYSSDGKSAFLGCRQESEMETKGSGCCHNSFSWVMSLVQPETAAACVYPENSSIAYGWLGSVL